MLTDKEKALIRQIKKQRALKKSNKRVALFMRVSTFKQADKDDQVPIPVQKELLLEFIGKHQDWEPCGIEYAEVNSAFKLSFKERATIAHAINDAADDKFDIILFFKHDRLSRISDEYTTILKEFWELGVEPWDYEKQQPLTIKSQMDKLVRFVEGWQSETESTNTSFRVSQNMAKYAEEGRWLGGTSPYGFRYKELTVETVDKALRNSRNKRRVRLGIEQDPEEAQMVQKIFQLYVSGYGSSKICSILNNSPYNYRKRNGKLLDESMILSIIKNPIYIGYPTWGKTSMQNKYFERKNKNEWVVSQEKIEEYRIITDELWEKAQQCYQERSTQARKGKSFSRRSLGTDRLLRGIAVCGYCGEPLVSKTYSDSKTNYHKDGYICRSFKRKSPCSSSYGFWDKESLENIVINAISHFFNELIVPDEKKLLDRVMDLYKKMQNYDNDEYKQLEKAIKQLKIQQEFYVTEFNKLLIGEQSSLPEKVIKEQMFKIQSELEVSEKKFDDLLKIRNSKPLDIELLKSIISELKSWNEIFAKAEVETQKTMLQQIIDCILVFDDKVEIKFDFSYKDLMNFLSGSEKDKLNLSIEEFDSRIQKTQTFKYVHKIKVRNEGRKYWEIVSKWEEKLGKDFGKIIADMRKEHSPDEVIKILGISRGFLYYHFGKYMDRIWCLQNHYAKPLKDIIIEMKKQNRTMTQISEELGLGVTTLYNHLKK